MKKSEKSKEELEELESFENYAINYIGKKKVTQRQKRERKKSNETKKILKIIIFIFLICFIGLYFLNKKSELILNKNGILTKAKITNIIKSDNFENRITTYTEYYIIEYEFITQEKKIKSIYEITEYDFESYFKKKPNVNDSIDILYKAKKPKINKIKMRIKR
jgi:hypothetical protein